MKKTIILSFLFMTWSMLMGQDVVVTTEAPSVVTVGEKFRVTWTVNSRGGNIEPPEFTDFYLLMGPQSSYSHNKSIVNGKVTQTIKNSYTYYLQATREGKFTLGPAIYTDKKEEYKSRSVTIEAINAEEQTRTESGTEREEGELAETNQSGSVSSSDLYVRLLVNRTRVTIGEHIVATLKIYSRVNLSGIQEVKFPAFNGFLKTDLQTTPLRALERENVNGQIYNTGVLQRFLIYPQKAGTLSIEPSTLTVLLQEQTRSKDPFFGDFFSSFNTVPKVIASLPVSIEVSPLPGGRPDSFYGTVGSIALSSEINLDTITVNEALTLRLQISGNGNLKLSSPPEFLLSPDIEIYDPKIESDLESTSKGTEGTKTFEYVLIPRHHGQFEIPQIKYSYFDPDIGTYKTLRSESHNFFVRKGSGAEDETQVFGAVNKENITYLGRDIRYIYQGNSNLKKKNPVIISRSSFTIMYLSAILIFIVIVIWRREHLKRNSDLARVKNRKAAKIASLRLKTAGRLLKDNNNEEFYAELLKALWGYLGDKLNIPVSDLNALTASDLLSARGIDDKTAANIVSIIEACEYSRYSPTGDRKDNADIYKAAEDVIKAIENEI